MADGRVLIIAASDSGGGAGVQADIKTVTVLGGYAASAITAITVQNTLGVFAVHPLAPDLIEAQARAVLEDIGADAIKIGVLAQIGAVEAVARVLADFPDIPVVLDPVLAAKDATDLSGPGCLAAIKARLLHRLTLLTPNAPEAAALTHLPVTTIDEMRLAGEALRKAGAAAVLMKGGHIPGQTVTDLLMGPAGETRLDGPRMASRHTHGTGCTLSSACAVGLGQGLPLAEAVARAWAYTAEAIRRAPGLGGGAGPLDHGWPLRSP